MPCFDSIPVRINIEYAKPSIAWTPNRHGYMKLFNRRHRCGEWSLGKISAELVRSSKTQARCQTQRFSGKSIQRSQTWGSLRTGSILDAERFIEISYG